MHPLPGLPDEWYCNRKYRRKESRNVDCLSILQGNLEHFLANLLHFNNKIYIVQNTIWSYKSRPCFYLHYLFAASGVDKGSVCLIAKEYGGIRNDFSNAVRRMVFTIKFRSSNSQSHLSPTPLTKYGNPPALVLVWTLIGRFTSQWNSPGRPHYCD